MGSLRVPTSQEMIYNYSESFVIEIWRFWLSETYDVFRAQAEQKEYDEFEMWRNLYDCDQRD